MHARHLRLLLILLAVAAFSYGARTSMQKARQRAPFWDLDYHRAAAERYGDRSDPYLSDGSPTGYYYSASILGALALVFQDFETDPVYLGSMGVGIVAALALTIGALRRRSAPLLLCVLYTLALGNGQALYLFLSGNLTWLAGLLKGASLLVASRRQWRAFYLLVGVAALIKPDALVLLVLPFALRALMLVLMACLFKAGLVLLPLLVLTWLLNETAWRSRVTAEAPVSAPSFRESSSLSEERPVGVG